MSEIATIKVLSIIGWRYSDQQLTLKGKDFDESISAENAFKADYVKATFEFHNSYLHEVVKKVGIKIRGAYTRRLMQKSW